MNTTYANETNNIADAAYTCEDVDYSCGKVSLSDPDLIKIDRIRLLTSPGFPMWDLSYCYGTLRDGRHVQVDLNGHYQLRKGKGHSIKGQLIAIAKDAGRFAKELGMLDDNVISALW